MGADKVHALLAVLAVEGIVLGNLNGQAVGVAGAITALGSLLGRGVLDLSTEGDIVVNVLSPGDEHHGNSVVVAFITNVDIGGDQTSGGKWVAVGGSTRRADAVSIVGWEETMVAMHGSSPVGHLQVVAEAGDGAVPLDRALGSHEEGRAVVLNDGLGSVDQGKAIGNGVAAQAIPLFMNNSDCNYCANWRMKNTLTAWRGCGRSRG